ncbi:glycine cleavage system transcriptional regulator GcvA [soil metagenome]
MSSTPAAPRPKMPPLKALLAFAAAARLGSFTRAADELAVTLSAVSHQIQQLEEFLGVQLFQRHAGRVSLTTDGRTYAGEVERAFATIANATQLVAPQLQSGHLVVASHFSFATKWLQPRVPSFLQQHPNVKFRLSTLSGSEDLQSRRFDIAITYGRPTGMNGVEPLLLETLKPMCSPEVAARADLHRLADLSRATLIHSSNLLGWQDYFAALGVTPVHPANELWIDRSMMAIEAAVNGLGVVLESEILAGPELRDGRLVCPFEAASTSVEQTSYFLIRAQTNRISPQSADFERWLREALEASDLAVA